MEQKTLNTLPEEIKIFTLKFLDLKSIAKMRIVSKDWRQLIDKDNVWIDELKKKTSYQCKTSETAFIVCTRLLWLESLTIEKLYLHFVPSAFEKLLNDDAKYQKRKQNDKNKFTCDVLDIKLLICTPHLYDKFKAELENRQVLVSGSWGMTETENYSMLYWLQLNADCSKEVAQFFYERNIEIDYAKYFLSNLNFHKTSTFEEKLILTQVRELIKLLQNYQINIFSSNLANDILYLYEKNASFNIHLNQEVLRIYPASIFLYILSYFCEPVAVSVINDAAQQRKKLSDNEMISLAARYPRVARILLEDKNFVNKINPDELKSSKPSLLSSAMGALVGGILGLILSPIIYYIKIFAKFNCLSLITVGIFPLILIVPAAIYGLIRGVHLGITKGFIEACQTPIILMEQKIFLQYKKWNKRNFRATTVVDSASSYKDFTPLICNTAENKNEKTPLLTKSKILNKNDKVERMELFEKEITDHEEFQIICKL